MGKTSTRYVAKAENGLWRVFDRKQKKYWGNPTKTFPDAILAELNGLKRSDVLIELCRGKAK